MIVADKVEKIQMPSVGFSIFVYESKCVYAFAQVVQTQEHTAFPLKKPNHSRGALILRNNYIKNTVYS